MSTCLNCQAEFTEPKRRGRPRKFCHDCAPPGDHGANCALWRKFHPEAVAAYNESRRVVPVTPWDDPAYREWYRQEIRKHNERMARR
jgi:hypothetical protein